MDAIIIIITASARASLSAEPVNTAAHSKHYRYKSYEYAKRARSGLQNGDLGLLLIAEDDKLPIVR